MYFSNFVCYYIQVNPVVLILIYRYFLNNVNIFVYYLQTYFRIEIK